MSGNALTCRVGFHVGAKDGIDPGLISLLLPKPLEQIGVKPHGHNLLAARQHDLGVLPECLVRGMCVRISLNAFAYFRIT
jgi:hypothetical protein